jgi:hypothetical protein
MKWSTRVSDLIAPMFLSINNLLVAIFIHLTTYRCLFGKMFLHHQSPCSPPGTAEKLDWGILYEKDEMKIKYPGRMMKLYLRGSFIEVAKTYFFPRLGVYRNLFH